MRGLCKQIFNTPACTFACGLTSLGEGRAAAPLQILQSLRKFPGMQAVGALLPLVMSIHPSETDMSNPIQFFSHLCLAINAFQNLKATERQRAANRDAGAQAFDAAMSLVPEILRRGDTGAGLICAMKSGSTDLVMNFPAAPYGTFNDSLWSQEVEGIAGMLDPDVVLALSSRGLSLNSALATFMTRAFRQKDERLRKWALDYLAPNPGDFKWMDYLTPENIQRRPDFTEDLLTRAIAANPTAASLWLANALRWHQGVQVALLHQAGVRLSDTENTRIKDIFSAISNHQKLRITRGSVAAFARDEAAIFAARHLFRQ